ncbi:MAG: hypothetical protein U1E37_12275 [Sphingomonadaceae bacterium]|jgi:nitrous oxide reductase accessory protein NosL
MKKVLFAAIAGSSIMLAGCSKGEDATPVEATPVAEASLDTGASDAASGEADAGTASEAGSETTSGGTHP